jgi:hypothetical protein
MQRLFPKDSRSTTAPNEVKRVHPACEAGASRDFSRKIPTAPFVLSRGTRSPPMKPFVALAVLFLCHIGFSPLMASPDLGISIHETLFGENEDAYAVIRTRHDNVGRSGTDHHQTHFVEIAKADGRTLNETLILDATKTWHAAKPDETIHSRDDQLTLAALVLRYRPVERHQLTPTELAKFHASQHGITLEHAPWFKKQPIVSPEHGDDLSKGNWNVNQGIQSRGLYLQVQLNPFGDGENQITKWLYFPTDLSDRVRQAVESDPPEVTPLKK